MAKESDKINPSEAARAMRAVNSPAQQDAARENGRLGGRPLKPLAEIPCTCGKCPGDPKTSCARGRAIRRRQQAGQPLVWE